MGKNQLILQVKPKNTYFGTEHVTGSLELHINKSINIREITLEVQGNEHLTRGQRYLFLKFPIQLSGGLTTEQTLGPNLYVFNFSSPLPHKLPATCRFPEGEIKYLLIANVNVKFGKDLRQTQELHISGDIHESEPFINAAPFVQNENKNFLIGSGELQCKVTATKQYAYIGDDIKLYIEANNQSTKTVHSMTLQLIQKTSFAPNPGSTIGQIKRKQVLDPQKAAMHLNPNSTANHSATIKIRSDLVPSLENNGANSVRLIRIRYLIRVILEVGKATDMRVDIPVIIKKANPLTDPKNPLVHDQKTAVPYATGAPTYNSPPTNYSPHAPHNPYPPQNGAYMQSQPSYTYPPPANPYPLPQQQQAPATSPQPAHIPYPAPQPIQPAGRVSYNNTAPNPFTNPYPPPANSPPPQHGTLKENGAHNYSPQQPPHTGYPPQQSPHTYHQSPQQSPVQQHPPQQQPYQPYSPQPTHTGYPPQPQQHQQQHNQPFQNSPPHTPPPMPTHQSLQTLPTQQPPAHHLPQHQSFQQPHTQYNTLHPPPQPAHSHQRKSSSSNPQDANQFHQQQQPQQTQQVPQPQYHTVHYPPQPSPTQPHQQPPQQPQQPPQQQYQQQPQQPPQQQYQQQPLQQPLQPQQAQHQQPPQPQHEQPASLGHSYSLPKNAQPFGQGQLYPTLPNAQPQPAQQYNPFMPPASAPPAPSAPPAEVS